jgi:hypothetical protein
VPGFPHVLGDALQGIDYRLGILMRVIGVPNQHRFLALRLAIGPNNSSIASRTMRIAC